jgi:hypothetical protein
MPTVSPTVVPVPYKRRRNILSVWCGNTRAVRSSPVALTRAWTCIFEYTYGVKSFRTGNFGGGINISAIISDENQKSKKLRKT